MGDFPSPTPSPTTERWAVPLLVARTVSCLGSALGVWWTSRDMAVWGPCAQPCRKQGCPPWGVVSGPAGAACRPLKTSGPLPVVLGLLKPLK